MSATSTPLSFIYGLADEISGAQILAHAKVALPNARCVGLLGLGHYPQIECPPDFISALRSILSDASVAS